MLHCRTGMCHLSRPHPLTSAPHTATHTSLTPTRCGLHTARAQWNACGACVFVCTPHEIHKRNGMCVVCSFMHGVSVKRCLSGSCVFCMVSAWCGCVQVASIARPSFHSDTQSHATLPTPAPVPGKDARGAHTHIHMHKPLVRTIIVRTILSMRTCIQ